MFPNLLTRLSMNFDALVYIGLLCIKKIKFNAGGCVSRVKFSL